MDASTVGEIPAVAGANRFRIPRLRVASRIAVYFGLCLIAVICNLAFSFRLPWGGDEWYTYHDSPLMAAPNAFLIFLAKRVLGEVSVHNFLLYRQIGLFWFILTIGYLLYKDYRARFQPLFLFQSVFLILSSFVIFQVQFFRYYSFYLFCSVLVFYLLWHVEKTGYAKCRLLMIGSLIISPFLFVILTWQLLVFIIWNEVRLMRARGRLLSLMSLIGACAILFVFSNRLFVAVFQIIFDKPILGAQGTRGLSLGGLSKPIYATFQFVFGYDLEPTENIAVAALFILVAAGFVYGLWRLRRENRKLFTVTVVGGIIPFVLLYWLVEPLTPPGATQLESKQALFFLPFFVAVLAPSYRNTIRAKSLIIPGALLVGAALGLHASLTHSRVDWSRIVELARNVQEQGGPVLVDGRARESLLFYGADKLNRNQIYDVSGPHIEDIVKSASVVASITGDWKSYQLLSVEQNWNSGKSSEERVTGVEKLLAWLRDDKECVQSYVQYPFFAFVYSKAGGNRSEPKPGYFGVPYQDVYFPIAQDNVTSFGCQDVKAGQPFDISVERAGELSIYYFIETRGGAKEGDRIGSIRVGGDEIALRLGSLPTDKYQSIYSRSLAESEVWHEWKKRPVFTQSLRYPGSFFASTGKIFMTNFKISSGGILVVERPDVTLHLCAIRLS